MSSQCGAFCSFCGRCGRRVSEEFRPLKPKDILPPGKTRVIQSEIISVCSKPTEFEVVEQNDFEKLK